MSKPFDATLKHLLETYPTDWLRFLGIEPAGPVELIDADLATISAEADKVFRIDEPEPWLLHLELQASYDPSLPNRNLLYSVLLTHRHGLPARSVVVLLRPKADGPAMNGIVRRAVPSDEPYLDFRYESIRLWEIPVETVLQAGIGTLPLVPLAAGAESRLDEVIERMDRRVRTGVQSADVADMWAATYILLGLMDHPEIGKTLLQGIRTMEESVTYQEILLKGEARGEARGKAEGILEGARRVLLAFGTKRLGAPRPRIKKAIDAINDFDRLERFTECVTQVTSWDELLQTD